MVRVEERTIIRRRHGDVDKSATVRIECLADEVDVDERHSWCSNIDVCTMLCVAFVWRRINLIVRERYDDHRSSSDAPEWHASKRE